MAEKEEHSKVNDASIDLQQGFPNFVEVICKSSGKARRFAAGTEAWFALNLIKRKLDGGFPLASHIEAVKEGEEPITFGPISVLVNYGHGWKLQTVTETQGDLNNVEIYGTTKKRASYAVCPPDGSNFIMKEGEASAALSLPYIGKILLAFLLLFVLGAIFTVALENLPGLILYINSSM